MAIAPPEPLSRARAARDGPLSALPGDPVEPVPPDAGDVDDEEGGALAPLPEQPVATRAMSSSTALAGRGP